MPAVGVAGAWALAGAVAASSTAAIIAGIAVYAVVGAAIGGLYAGLSGGDIGKGVLYGAVGGAVAAVGSVALVGAAGSGGILGGSAAGTSTTVIQGNTTATIGSNFMGGSAINGATTVGTGTSMGSVATQGIIATLGSAMEGQAAAKDADINRAWTSEEAAKDRAAAMDLAKTKAGGGGGANHSLEIAKIQADTAQKSLDETIRQYDDARSVALEKTEAGKSALVGMRVARAQGSLDQNAPGIDRQMYQNSEGIMNPEEEENVLAA